MEKLTKGDSSYGHVLKYTGLFGGVQGLNIAIALVRNKLVALILGPGGMGLMSLFNSTIRFVSDSTNLGIPTGAVKQIAQDLQGDDEEKVRASVRLVRTWVMISALFGMLICALLSPLLNKWTFTWGDHTLHFILLSPIVALTAISGGETAILKALRQLKSLAAISILNIVGALVTSIPLYYFFGQRGIIPSLIIIAIIQMVLTIRCSYRLVPPEFNFTGSFVRGGLPMVRLGVAFVIAAMMGSGADLLIRSFLNRYADLDVVGIFNAGYMVIMTYGGMVFASMETDYFPRLAAINETGAVMSKTVNRQIEVSLLIISPLLVALIIGLPILVPLLYSNRFTPAIPMMQVMALALYMRSAKLPLAYIALARADSRAYIFLEAAYDIAVVPMVIVGYQLNGLVGIGYAITLLSVLDFIMLNTFTWVVYKYRPSRGTIAYLALQLPLGIAAWLLTLTSNQWLYWIAGILLALLSLAISLAILHRKTNLLQSLRR